MEKRLIPPPTKPHTSVARVTNEWYIGSTSKALKKKPMAVVILGIPLVLFRNEKGVASALLDRCPHRNVPLSLGKVDENLLQCGYHGWAFDGQGVCRKIPGLCSEVEGKARRVNAYPVREQDGYIWVFMNPEIEPETEPYRLPLVDTPGYTTVKREVTVQGSMHATIENALDVPHTAFLHAGLFRGKGDGHQIEAVVRRGTDRVEAEYVGEPRPEGLMAKLFAPQGGTVYHVDRFIMPSVAEVEYRLGDRSHVIATTVCTPISDFETRMNAAVSFKLPLPGWLVRPFIQPVAMSVIRQDARILKAQTEWIERFGGEQFVSTEIDVLGGHIYRMLRAAERGERLEVPTEGHEERIRLNT